MDVNRKKLVIIINGKGGVGKDFLIDLLSKNSTYNIMNESSIDCIKDLAKIVGWDGSKDNESRKFLSDLKKVVSDFNDFPTKDMIKKIKQFIVSFDDIMFIHIREPKEIDKLISEAHKRDLPVAIRTLLITELSDTTIIPTTFGNDSDDNVENYDYDYTYLNNKGMIKSLTSKNFKEFIDNIFKHDSATIKEMKTPSFYVCVENVEK